MKKENATSIGWWIDSTIPGTLEQFAKLLPPKVNAPAFAAWLGPELAKYRNAVALRKALPSRAREIAGARRLVVSVDDTLSALRGLPPYAKAMVEAATVRDSERIGTTWHELTQRLEADLTLMHVLMRGTASSLAAAPAKRGRKTAAPRDELLDAIIRRLRKSGLLAEDARALAAQILVRCRIKVAGDGDSIKRAARRGQKRKS